MYGRCTARKRTLREFLRFCTIAPIAFAALRSVTLAGPIRQYRPAMGTLLIVVRCCPS